MKDNLDRAKQGEDLAAEYLVRNGFTIIARNYRFGHGEIDIIAQDGEYTVFVEVKTRTSEKFGAPEYSITRGKQKQLFRIASGYLYEQGKSTLPCRFDVIAIEFRNGKPEINHISNAFTNLP